jgi:hypothetical protein
MTFTDSQLTKLKQLVSEGIQVNGEIETLKEGLKDTVAAIAEEMDIKPSVLNKVIRVAYKAELDKHRDEFSELEAILESIGRG